ncbi:hypothetical protein JZU46_02885 [bacterium]|nr:hypothetical protein [bacterium]
MGRASEFYHYISLKEKPTGTDLDIYCSLTITPEIEQRRKDLIDYRETGLISKGDGSFLLF